VRFASPTNGAKLTGVTELRLETNLGEQQGTLALSLDGEPLATFDQVTTAIKLNTTTLKDGNQPLELKATTEDGDVYTDRVDVNINNPEHQFRGATANQRSYGRGDEVVLTLNYTKPGLKLNPDFSVIDSEFDKTKVRVTEVSSGQYEVRYTISDNDSREPREYEVPITSIGSDSLPLVSNTEVLFVGKPKLPLKTSAKDAVFSDRAAPIILSDLGPKIESIDLPERLIQGQPQTVTVKWSGSEDDPAESILLGSPTSSGSWIIPLSEPSSSGEIEIPIEALSSSAGLGARSIPIEAAVVGTSGTTRRTVVNDTELITSKLFGVRFLLNWATSADLDLEITTPNGSVINYQSPEAQHGKLEIDSNSMCTQSALFPMESIAWDPKNIVQGTYGIKVTQFDPCGQKVTPYQVTILACGRAETISGTMTSGDSSTVEEHELSPFVLDCLQRVHGRVTFQKITPTTLDYPPVVGVPVRIVEDGNSRVITKTDDDGNYDVTLPINVSGKLSVVVDASWAPPGVNAPRVQVWGLSNQDVYRAIGTVGVPSSGDLEQNVTIMEENDAGAFNILENLRKAYIWTNMFFGATTSAKITPVAARWTRGFPTPNSRTGGSYYTTEILWIDGIPLAGDEFSDSVVVHEYSHHIAKFLGLDNNPGGEHYVSEKLSPTFAWGEGLASGLGQSILTNPIYRSGNPRVGFYVDVESTPKGILFDADATMGAAYGTNPSDSMTGKVNEFLVAGLLYDVLDPANEPGNDEIDKSWAATRQALASYLGAKDFKQYDRGYKGKDLVDFIDGWRCYETKAANNGRTYSDAKLNKLLVYREFPYSTPTSPTRCP
jgi:hypothetical protein